MCVFCRRLLSTCASLCGQSLLNQIDNNTITAIKAVSYFEQSVRYCKEMTVNDVVSFEYYYCC